MYLCYFKVFRFFSPSPQQYKKRNIKQLQKSAVEPHKGVQVNKVSSLDGSTSASGSFRGVSLRDLPRNLDKNSRDLKNNGLCSVLEVMECGNRLIRFNKAVSSLKKT